MAVIARLREIATFHENQMTWRIFRRRFSVQTFIGVVRAPNHSAAIQKAIQQFKITSEADQLRLFAQPRDI